MLSGAGHSPSAASAMALTTTLGMREAGRAGAARRALAPSTVWPRAPEDMEAKGRTAVRTRAAAWGPGGFLFGIDHP